MKRFLVFGMFAVMAAGAKAVVIYDTITGATNGFIMGTPRSLNGDIGDTLSPGAGTWSVTGFDIRFYAHIINNYAAGDLQFRVRFYDNYNASAPANTSVMSTQLGPEIVVTLGALNVTTANSLFEVAGLTVPANSVIMNGTDFGFEMRGFRRDVSGAYVASDDFSLAGHGNTGAGFVGTSNAGFYRDVDLDGLLESGAELRFPTNTPPAQGAIRIHANLVPEPASLAILGLGAAALLRRRRK